MFIVTEAMIRSPGIRLFLKHPNRRCSSYLVHFKVNVAGELLLSFIQQGLDYPSHQCRRPFPGEHNRVGRRRSQVEDARAVHDQGGCN